MAYAPAAEPLPATPEQAGETRAPPTIDSHGRLPMTACYPPDSVTPLLMWLAMLSTLAPRAFRALDLSNVRLAPGLLLTASMAWSLLPSLEPARTLPARFHLVEPVSAAVAAGLLAISFLHLISDALMPAPERSSPARSLGAMAAAGLAVMILLIVVGTDVALLLDQGALAPDWQAVGFGLLGLPTGVGLLLVWRRFGSRLFNLLLVPGSIGLLIATSGLLPGLVTAPIVFQVVALTVVATLGEGLRGLGLEEWQGLTGRAAWILGWILRILLVTLFQNCLWI